MSQVKVLHDFYRISHNGDVNAGLSYLETEWNNEEVKNIFRGSRLPEFKDSGYKFPHNGYNYHLFYDGDGSGGSQNYFLK